MSDTGESDQAALSELRTRIDAIDAEMHRLLITRGEVIDSLIHLKGTGRQPGAAFRPGREADMMRAIVARHEGQLPLATVEHIWREIITTFTRMQAPFDVAIDVSVEPDRMRDLARFVFGFSVPLKPVESAGGVVTAVRDRDGHTLGIVARAARGAWWRRLIGERAPRIMALLPFIDLPGRPADLPAFVISPPLSDSHPMEIAVFAATVSGPMHNIEGTEILAAADSEFLIAAPSSRAPDKLAWDFGAAGVNVGRLSPVGSFARGVTLGGRSTLLYEAPA